jgi:hypothetical protein
MADQVVTFLPTRELLEENVRWGTLMTRWFAQGMDAGEAERAARWEAGDYTPEERAALGDTSELRGNVMVYGTMHARRLERDEPKPTGKRPLIR